MDLTPTVPIRSFSSVLQRFAEEVGETDPVAVAGGRSAWEVGGVLASDTRLVTAPAGIVEYDAAEMTVRVGAGTTLAELLSTLGEEGQEVALPSRPGGTVGGAVSVGWSDLRRPRIGPLRDALLEASVVTASGRLVRCGGPTVKNVTGYDLARLLVGSLGTLALIGELVLRTRPVPECSRWLKGRPSEQSARILSMAPSAQLWDGSDIWLLLEGHPTDVDSAAAVLVAQGFEADVAPPVLPPYRWSLDPAQLHATLGDDERSFVAELGVGTVHHEHPPAPRRISTGVRTLNERMKLSFDPTGRLNPGRNVLTQ